MTDIHTQHLIDSILVSLSINFLNTPIIAWVYKINPQNYELYPLPLQINFRAAVIGVHGGLSLQPAWQQFGGLSCGPIDGSYIGSTAVVNLTHLVWPNVW